MKSRLISPWRQGLSGLLALGLTLPALAGIVPVAAGQGPTFSAVHAPIYINGLASLNATNGVTSGSGTEADPYVIEGWAIDSTTANAIEVRYVPAYLTIRNVSISGDPNGFGQYYGIYLLNVDHATIENVTIRGTTAAISAGTNATIRYNDLAECNGSCLVLRGRNVVAEGNSVARFRQVGIRTGSLSDSLIAGNEIWGGWSGIYLESSTNVSVRGNHLHHNNGSGVYAGFSNMNVTLESNIIEDNPGRAVFFEAFGSRELHVYNNTIVRNGGAIYIWAAETVDLRGNNISDNRASGVETNARNQRPVDIVGNVIARNADKGIASTVPGTIADNRIEENHAAGLWTSASSLQNISGNTFVGDSLVMFASPDPSLGPPVINISADNTVNGLPLRFLRDCADTTVDGLLTGQLIALNCTNLRIVNLSLARADDAIHVALTDGAWVAGNRIDDMDGTALKISGGRNVTAANNTLRGGSEGVHAVFTENLTLEGNDLRAIGDDAVYLEHSTNLTLRSNVIALNPGSAIRTEYTANLRAFENLISHNANLIDAQPYSTGGLFYHNSIYMKDDLASSERVGFAWDNGYPSAGNFWSPYEGVDDCSGPAQDICSGPDGIGDTPWTAFAQIFDRYPLMDRYPLPRQPPLPAFEILTRVPFEGRAVEMTAAGSGDLEDKVSALEVRWDWTDDGTFDTPWTTVKEAGGTYRAAGNYTVRMEVRNAGGLTASVTHPVAVHGLSEDSTPPVIVMLGLGGGSQATDPELSVLGWTRDDDGSGVVLVEARVGGGAWVTATGTESWNASVHLAYGLNTVSARATDGAGNPSGIVSANVTLVGGNASFPTVAVTAPADGAQTPDTALRVSGTATAGSGSSVANVWVRLNGGPWVAAVGTLDWSLDVVLRDGTNTIEVRAIDSAGKPSVVTELSVFSGVVAPKDTTPPLLALVSPNNDTVVRQPVVRVNGTASDGNGSGVVRVEVRVGQGAWVEANGTTTWSVLLTLQDGSNGIAVRAWDTEGNPSAEVDVTLIYRAPDTVPPVIQPEAATQATVGVPISLSVAASDGEGIVSVTVFYKGPRDGSFKAVRMNFSDGKYTAPVPALTEPGEVQYFFLARDLAGNEARSPAVGTLSVTMEPAGKAANSVEFEAVSVAAAMAASVAALLLWRGKVR